MGFFSGKWWQGQWWKTLLTPVKNWFPPKWFTKWYGRWFFRPGGTQPPDQPPTTPELPPAEPPPFVHRPNEGGTGTGLTPQGNLGRDPECVVFDKDSMPSPGSVIGCEPPGQPPPQLIIGCRLKPEDPLPVLPSRIKATYEFASDHKFIQLADADTTSHVQGRTGPNPGDLFSGTIRTKGTTVVTPNGQTATGDVMFHLDLFETAISAPMEDVDLKHPQPRVAAAYHADDFLAGGTIDVDYNIDTIATNAPCTDYTKPDLSSFRGTFFSLPVTKTVTRNYQAAWRHIVHLRMFFACRPPIIGPLPQPTWWYDSRFAFPTLKLNYLVIVIYSGYVYNSGTHTMPTASEVRTAAPFLPAVIIPCLAYNSMTQNGDFAKTSDGIVYTQPWSRILFDGYYNTLKWPVWQIDKEDNPFGIAQFVSPNDPPSITAAIAVDPLDYCIANNQINVWSVPASPAPLGVIPLEFFYD